jgi:hypothetical protein
MLALVDETAEVVLPAYDEAFDPVGFKGLGASSQRCRGGQRSVGSMLVVVPLVLTKRATEMGLVPDQRAVQKFGPQRLRPVFHDRVHARHPDTGAHSGDFGVVEDLIDQRWVLAVTVADKESHLCDASRNRQIHQQVADSLRHLGGWCFRL